ncbi:hypothetical protein Q31a_41600 [Aureliella helgolandensis]|uniref:Uncharacterized protein n=1 Tax=Aureliella helgolandensis TaxID=2527968 RepID=A0A518GB55_9BACT|nr:hypothetical protein Q31a_41600 [Aureliella helgolandensis]
MRYASIAGFNQLDHVFRRFSFIRSRTPVRWVALCLLGIHLVLILGISIPVYPTKTVTERFPCENSPCGCSSAAFCWDKCCCHTDVEKLAWAESNKVQAPKFLVARVKPKSEVVLSKQEKGANCCSTANPESCHCGSYSIAKSDSLACSQCSAKRQTQTGTPRQGCCANPGVTAEQKEQPAPRECCGSKASQPTRTSTSNGRPLVRIVLLDPALRCLGIQMAVALFSDSWIPERDSIVEPPDPICLGWLCRVDVICPSIYLPVDGPVPRAA